MPLGMEISFGPGDFVLDENPAPPPQKGGGPPIFGPFLFQPNGCVHQDVTWYKGRPRPRPHRVRWGPSSLSPKRGRSPLPNFRPMSIVAKQLDKSRRHLARRWALVQATLCQTGTQLLPKRGRASPIFGRLLWPNGCMDQYATWYEGRPRPRRLSVRWGPAIPRKKAHAPHPIFGQCLLWPNSLMH